MLVNSKLKAAVVLLIICVCVPSLFAHHGLALFDTKRMVDLEGTVTDFQWISPHSYIYADLKDEKGKVANWRLELGSPAMLGHFGWNPHSLKHGDQVKVSGFVAKDGSPYMAVHAVILSAGKKLSGAP
jgi:hypothetical protein